MTSNCVSPRMSYAISLLLHGLPKSHTVRFPVSGISAVSQCLTDPHFLRILSGGDAHSLSQPFGSSLPRPPPFSHLPTQGTNTCYCPHIEHPPRPHVACDAKERALYSPLDHRAGLRSQQCLSTEVWNRAGAILFHVNAKQVRRPLPLSLEMGEKHWRALLPRYRASWPQPGFRLGCGHRNRWGSSESNEIKRACAAVHQGEGPQRFGARGGAWINLKRSESQS